MFVSGQEYPHVECIDASCPFIEVPLNKRLAYISRPQGIFMHIASVEL